MRVTMNRFVDTRGAPVSAGRNNTCTSEQDRLAGVAAGPPANAGIRGMSLSRFVGAGADYCATG